MGSWFQFPTIRDYVTTIDPRTPQRADPVAIPWRTYFPFPSPYPHQTDGIEAAIETSLDGGITIIEGACGTGKTLLGISAALGLINHPATPFERILVVTSVKQQLRAFEDSLREINDALPTATKQVTAATLVGKADLCPLVQQDVIDRELVYDTCQELREATRDLMETTPPSHLTTEATEGVCEVDGNSYCSYYAQYLADRSGTDREAAFDPATMPGGLLDPPTTLEHGIDRGSCPHAGLTAGIESVDVLIANYYHAFDPQTRESLTSSVIGPETILVADEAHMLEPQVRSVLSSTLSIDALHETQAVLTTLQSVLTNTSATSLSRTKRFALLNTLDRQQVFPDDISTYVTFLDDVQTAVNDIVPSECTESEDRVSLATGETDRLCARMAELGWDDWPLPEDCAMGDALAEVVALLDSDCDPEPLTNTCGFLQAWWRHPRTTYMRSMSPATDGSWSLEVRNLVPAREIARDLDRFGATILMSATLSPIDVYRQVIGVDTLDVPVRTKRFEMTFPANNRASFTVTLPPFTYTNRGEPDDPTPVRAAYADALVTIAQSPGNVLVCLPSYSEAAWAADVITDRTEKPTLLDSASGEATTEQLKDEFFDGSAKVLVTSLRGTLTEGVDYSGDRLKTVAICGVPVVDASDPQTQAIRAAYDESFGDGYRTALAAPAIRKTRQAIGRVIRGESDIGVRILLDSRYATDADGGLRSLIPPDEREEFLCLEPEELARRLHEFWTVHEPD